MSIYSDGYDLDYDEGYDLPDAEGLDDAEDSAAAQARRRRARALTLARRRTAARQGVAAPPPGPRAVVNAVKELDLQTQVQQDSLRSYSAAQRRRDVQTNLVPALSLLVAEGFRTFGTPENAFVRVGLEAAPLALLPWGPSYRGFRVIQHPLVVGGAGALALAFVGREQKDAATVHSLTVLGPAQLSTGGTDLFIADALDSRGRPAVAAVRWESDSPAVVAIDPVSGRVSAGTQPGVAIISATVDQVVRRFRVEVVPAASTSTSGPNAPK